MPEAMEVHLPTAEEVKQLHLQLMVVIVDRDKSKKVTEILQERHSHLHFACLGEGTANSEILDLLGLGATEKMLSLCIAPRALSKRLMQAVSTRMGLARPGKGIAFTMPLSGVSSAIMRMLEKDIQENQQDATEKEGESMPTGAKHDLIIAVINQGCSEDLMTVAKKAGVTGGTVIHARRVSAEDSVKFFGIAIQAEKEIVAMLTPHEKKRGIMQALVQSCGVKSEAKGIFLALPVDEVAGLPQPLMDQNL